MGKRRRTSDRQQEQHYKYSGILLPPLPPIPFLTILRLTRRSKLQYKAGWQGNVQRLFSKFPTDEDRELVADFILTCMHQENIAIKTKRVYISSLVSLSKYFDYKKSFNEMTAKDIASRLPG